MVYAVAMRTIKNFERALGRVMHWPPYGDAKATYRQQLTLYPHYMENANAYYEADGGIHFGYFESGPEAVFPGTVVFSCLSQDVIAHQVTHALLMGLNVEFDIGTNPDVAALHEGFADLIALFQHFSESDVLRRRSARFAETSKSGANSVPLLRSSAERSGSRVASGMRSASPTQRATGSRAGRTRSSTRRKSNHTPEATSSSARCSRPSRRSTSRASTISGASRRRAPVCFRWATCIPIS
jgi:hypothetical protein